jgi:ribonuclease HIII
MRGDCSEMALDDVRPARGFSISDLAQRERLRGMLTAAGASEFPAKSNEAWRFSLRLAGSVAWVMLYTSGRCVVGSAPAESFDVLVELVEAVADPPRENRPRRASRGESSTIVVPPETQPHIGVDEVGKGDLFGPLVSTAVYVDEATAIHLREVGVRDSKLLKDHEIRWLAREARQIVGDRSALTSIGPERFTSLHTDMRSEGQGLNELLAWAHARSIAALLKKDIQPQFVVLDQFSEARIMDERIPYIMRVRGIPLLQVPRAESDVAVAAASILARDRFLDWFEQESARLGFQLPKGGGQTAKDARRQIAAKFGQGELVRLSKLSFAADQPGPP